MARPHTLGLLCSLLLFSAHDARSASAQPLPPTVSKHTTLQHIEMPFEFGATVWCTPAPHELNWYSSYDNTPLKADAPCVALRLVNNGRPVRLPLIEDRSGPPEVTYQLTRPDGSVETVGPINSTVFIYTVGRENERIEPGRPLVGMRVDLLEHFSDLDAGEHTLRVSIDVPRRLERARDAHVISDRLRVETPLLRFRVVDGPTPARAENPPIRLQDRSEAPSGTVLATLTNHSDAPISMHADLGFNPDRALTNDAPAPLYNANECWTETGWVRDTRIGYCGVGMTRVTVEPHGSIPVVFRIHENQLRSVGIIRCVVTVETASGETLELATNPILRRSKYRWASDAQALKPRSP